MSLRLKKTLGWLVFAVLAIVAGLFLGTAGAGKTGALEIVLVTPSDDAVEESRQIVFHFNRPVVPLGRMERTADEIPATIEPALNCTWRWLDTATLACDLSEGRAFTPATRFKVTMKPGISDESGETLAAPFTHIFSTPGPETEEVRHYTYAAPQKPVLLVKFTLKVSRESVERALSFVPQTKLDGLVPVRAEAAPETLAEQYGLDNGGGPGTAEGGEFSGVWIISPARDLAPDTAYDIVEQPGLVSISGPVRGRGKGKVAETRTYGDFSFLGIDGEDIHGDPLEAKPGKREKNPRRFDIERSLQLTFSSPVAYSEIASNVKISPGGADSEEDKGEEDYEDEDDTIDQNDGDFTCDLPVTPRPYTTYRVTAPAGTIKDRFGRVLKKAIDITFSTDHLKPYAGFEYNTAVLESEVETDFPIVMTNMKSASIRYDALTPRGLVRGRIRAVPGNTVPDERRFMPTGLKSMLSGQTGLVVGRIVSWNPKHAISKDEEYGLNFFAQRTPFQVNVKIGHQSSLVWVTDLETAAPVAGARVRIYRGKVLSDPKKSKILGEGVTDAEGFLMLPGRVALGISNQWGHEEMMSDYSDTVTLVRVDKAQKMALLPLTGEFYTYSRGVWSADAPRYGHVKAWGLTAQGIYRAGDTIDYKIFVRDQDNLSLTSAPKKGYKLIVEDPTGKNILELKDISLNEFGAFDGKLPIPKSAAVGHYQFYLSSNLVKLQWSPITVLVTDFTPSPFRVTAQLSGVIFSPGDRAELSVNARLHGGGPYSGAEVKTYGQITEQMFSSDHVEARDFSFAPPPTEPFSDTGGDYYPETRTADFISEEKTLDQKGDLVSVNAVPETEFACGSIAVEASVSDDRGRSVAALATAKYVGAFRFVGLKARSWVFGKGKPALVGMIVTDQTGAPAEGSEVSVTVKRRIIKDARVMGPGNAYMHEYSYEWADTASGKIVSGKTAKDFSFVPPEPGEYRLVAAVTDEKGRSQKSWLDLWVTGEGYLQWDYQDSSEISVIAEKESLKVGDVARFRVKNPFAKATALVTVERIGVISKRLMTFDTPMPIIEIPVTKEMMPGFYLSVVVQSGRVSTPQKPGEADLGKPASRMGYARVEVTDPVKEIKVTAVTGKPSYRPGETVNVELSSILPDPSRKEPVEFSVAVVDEAVFDLIEGGRDRFDPYKGLYGLGGLDMNNYSLASMLIGIQRMEKKGVAFAAAGEDDKRQAVRNRFKFLAFWNPSIKADENGKAKFSFTAPDNLTGWRILAIAATPTDRMGLGEGTFTVTRPVEIRPALPNQLTVGDTFSAGFSILNRTDSLRAITVEAKVTGAGSGGSVRQTVNVEPFQRVTVSFPVKAASPGEMAFTARAAAGEDSDGLAVSIQVLAIRSLDHAAQYGSLTEGEARVSVKIPEDAHPDAGSLSVTLSPTIISNLKNAFDFMRRYPYECWEQKLSRAVAASGYLALSGHFPKDAGAERDAKALIGSVLSQAADFQAQNGGMCYYTPKNEYVCPYLSAYTALAFSWLTQNGRRVPDDVDKRLSAYLENLLRKDMSPAHYTPDMTADVRATALYALSRRGRIKPADIARFARSVPKMSLFGKAQFLSAALAAKAPQKTVSDIALSILGRASQTSGRMTFDERRDERHSWILSSGNRNDAAILSAFTALSRTAYGKALLGDAPEKLARSLVLAVGAGGFWPSTQENAFAITGLTDYARLFEKAKPDMLAAAHLGNETLGRATFNSFSLPAVELSRPLASSDIGLAQNFLIERKGVGRLYYTARASFAQKAEKPTSTNAGIEVVREYSVERDGKWVLAGRPLSLKRGDLVRVDLYVTIPAGRYYVVADDPVPGGLEPVNRDLATASAVDAAKAETEPAPGAYYYKWPEWNAYGWSRYSFYHQELRHDSARWYSDYLSKGRYHLSYVAQAVAAGTFTAMPTLASEMYSPDVYGKGLAEKLTVTD
ncbi:MAG: large extracellular alpha-helical protein [Deltaproteobacteria bacterium]|nr:large extracellular alpha-helical protein [Deltaproteobacteria bacterium]